MKPLIFMEWKERFEAELQQAEAARAQGNEGRARVCARRAAGLAAGEYLRRLGLPANGPSAYDHLKALAALERLSPQRREVAGHFLARANPDRSLSVEADLLAEARWLAGELLHGDD